MLLPHTGGFAITVGVLYCVATSTGRGAAVTFLPAGEEWENGEGAKGSPAVLVSPESFLAAIPIQILAFAAHTVTLQMFAEYSDGQAQDDDGGEDEDGMMTGGGAFFFLRRIFVIGYVRLATIIYSTRG